MSVTTPVPHARAGRDTKERDLVNLDLPRPRRTLARLARLLSVAALLAVPLTVSGLPGTVEPAHATMGDRAVGSWNMHGQTSYGESRWANNAIRGWMDRVHVLALQEAGSAPPPGAEWTHRLPGDAGVTEHEFTLPGGRHVFIYWGDTGQQRNGLAFVTRERARDVVQLAVPSDRDNSRPIIGVQIDTDWYFTGHARSQGGRVNDYQEMYETARQFMTRQNPLDDWAFPADFNYGPGYVRPELQNRVIATGEATHDRGGELDFVMLGQPTLTNNTMRLERYNVDSDHAGVLFDIVPCLRRDGSCQGPTPGHTFHFVSEQDPGSMITRGSTLAHYRPRPMIGAYQVQVRFSTQPNEYLLAFNNDTCIERNGTTTTTKPCDPANPDQHWLLEDNMIVDPDKGGILQPGPNSHLALGHEVYRWNARLTEKGAESDHDELKRGRRSVADSRPDDNSRNTSVDSKHDELNRGARAEADDRRNTGAGHGAIPRGRGTAVG